MNDFREFGTGLQQLRRVDEACERFEAAWRAGERPQIEAFLAGADASIEAPLFEELLKLDQELRAEAGESASADEYRRRFPRHAHRVDSTRHDEPITDHRPAADDLLALEGARLGDFELLEEIARGGMGIVYKARQISLNRTVALKVVRSGALADAQELARFRIEAEAAARLDHPGIVPVYQITESGGMRYYVMAFVDGPSLADRLKEGPLPAKMAAEIVQGAALAVHYAHMRGIVHRDLKPGNILLDRDGAPRVADFGLAKRSEGGADLTMTGQVLGTPSFMPPEQASGDHSRVDERSDVYALGAVLYATVTGRPPFQAASQAETLRQVIHEPPAAPQRLNPCISPDLATICLKCLEKAPGQRYASAHDLADDLRHFVRDEPIVARPIGIGERVRRWARRRPGVAALIALATALGLTLAIAGPITAIQKARLAQNEQEALQWQYRYLYVAHMNLAQQAADRNAMGRVRELLERHTPAPGREDRRGFEWGHLWALSHQDSEHWEVGVPLGCMAYSPDGATLVAAGSDQQIRVWDVAGGRERAVLPAGQVVCCLAYSRDGKLLAAGGDQSQVRVWDTIGWRILDSFSCKREVECVAFSPRDDRLLAIGSEDAAWLWDLASDEEAQPIYPGAMSAVAFSPDGERIAVGGQAGFVWIAKVGERLTSAHPIAFRHSAQHWISSLAFSPDGTRVVSACGDYLHGFVELKLWDVETRTLAADLVGHRQHVVTARFSADGATLVTASNDQTVILWDVASGKPRSVYQGHSSSVTGADFSPSGDRIASVGMDGAVRFWDVDRPAPRMVVEGQQTDVGGLAFSPDGLLVASVDDCFIHLWDVASGAPAGDLVEESYLGANRFLSMAFSGDGRWIATAQRNGDVTLWDVRTRSRAKVMPGILHFPGSLSFAANPLRLAAASVEDRLVRVWAPERKEIAWTLDNLSNPFCVFSPEGDRLAIWSCELTESEPQGELQVVELAYRGSRILRRIPGHLGGVVFSPSGEHLAYSTSTGQIELWSFVQDKMIVDFSSGEGTNVELAFSPDGRSLASGGLREIKLWDLETYEEKTTLHGHTGYVTALAFSPNGLTLASGGSDKTVRLWRSVPLDNKGSSNSLAQ
jgi:WD40 repeat protein/tRNA A-37 threonylcarbamoyl transferase component Bud32